MTIDEFIGQLSELLGEAQQTLAKDDLASELEIAAEGLREEAAQGHDPANAEEEEI